MPSVTQAEVRLTLETAIDMVNAIRDGDLDARALLAAAGFSGTTTASDAAMRRVERRMEALLPFLVNLPDLEVDEAAAVISDRLAGITIRPSVVDHDDVGHHIHWTPDSASYDDKVIADVLMALAQEVCDNGTARFGRCAAEDCDALFYDATRNRSRRFCSDPRCASRTHTADHRRRRRDDRARGVTHGV
jgi:hypothetical protein